MISHHTSGYSRQHFDCVPCNVRVWVDNVPTITTGSGKLEVFCPKCGKLIKCLSYTLGDPKPRISSWGQIR